MVAQMMAQAPGGRDTDDWLHGHCTKTSNKGRANVFQAQDGPDTGG